MKHFIAAAAFALLGTAAFAQSTAELAEQYVKMPQVQSMISDLFSPISLGNQVAAGLPAGMTLTDDKKQRIGDVMATAMNDLRPRMEELMISGSAETFTTDELQALIAFYGSEHGSKVMSKMQPFMATVMGQLAPEMQALQAKVGPEVVKIIQEPN